MTSNNLSVATNDIATRVLLQSRKIYTVIHHWYLQFTISLLTTIIQWIHTQVRIKQYTVKPHIIHLRPLTRSVWHNHYSCSENSFNNPPTCTMIKIIHFVLQLTTYRRCKVMIQLITHMLRSGNKACCSMLSFTICRYALERYVHSDVVFYCLMICKGFAKNVTNFNGALFYEWWDVCFLRMGSR